MRECVSCGIETVLVVMFADGERFSVCAGCLPACDVLTAAGALVEMLEVA